MTISSTTIIGKVEVLQNGTIQVRQDQVLTENNIEIGRVYYRYCLNPDDSLTNQDSMIQAIANAVWTPSVISAYKATLTVPQG